MKWNKLISAIDVFKDIPQFLMLKKLNYGCCREKAFQ